MMRMMGSDAQDLKGCHKWNLESDCFGVLFCGSRDIFYLERDIWRMNPDTAVMTWSFPLDIPARFQQGPLP